MRWTEIGTDAALDRVRQFAASVGADAVISADDLTLCWLARNRSLFEPACCVMAPPVEVLERFLPKTTQMGIAAQAGFDLLQTWDVTPRSGVAEIPESQFPICIRPDRMDLVRPPFKAKVLANRDEMTSWLASLESIACKLVAQPFRVGPNLIIHGVRDAAGVLLACTGYRTVRKYRGFAQSMEAFEIGPKLRESCRRFAEIAGLVGPFHFDLLHSEAENRTYYLEINVRMGGSTSKVVGLGYDEPAWVLRSFGMEPPRRDPLGVGSRRVTSKRSVARQIVSTLRNDPPDDLRYPREDPATTLLHLLREMVLVNDPAISLRGLAGSPLHIFQMDN
jgi:hypothetical protein